MPAYKLYLQVSPVVCVCVGGGGGGGCKQSMVILSSILCVPLYVDLNRKACHNMPK